MIVGRIGSENALSDDPAGGQSYRVNGDLAVNYEVFLFCFNETHPHKGLRSADFGEWADGTYIFRVVKCTPDLGLIL